jgi:hypothetical protein
MDDMELANWGPTGPTPDGRTMTRLPIQEERP